MGKDLLLLLASGHCVEGVEGRALGLGLQKEVLLEGCLARGCCLKRGLARGSC